MLSCCACASRWSHYKAISHLLEISRGALKALVDGNVLRPKRTPDGLTYEWFTTDSDRRSSPGPMTNWSTQAMPCRL